MSKRKKGASGGGRKGGDLRGIVARYMREHPDAQYFEMLSDLHRQGYRVNRHGSAELLGYWQDARGGRT